MSEAQLTPQRTRTAYALMVTDDGEQVLDEHYDDDVSRARALRQLLVENHDEIETQDNPIPDQVLRQGTDAVLEWYCEDIGYLSIDVHREELQVPVPAPQKLFHVITTTRDGQVAVDSFPTAQSRQLYLHARIASLVEVSPEMDEESLVDVMEDALDITLTLIDADDDLSSDDIEWHSPALDWD